MGKMRHLRRALRGCVGKVVGYQINDGIGAALAETLEQVIRGKRVHDDDLCFALSDDDNSSNERSVIAERLAAPVVIPAGKGGKATALVSVRGVALYDLEFQPYAFSTLLLARTMKALANDPEIGTIILDIDSPGGVVTGVAEAGDAIFAARDTTRVVALVNPLAASAAYWLASQASEIIAVPSADIGSVGVFMLHADCAGMMEQMGVKPTFIFADDSPYKVEGNAYEPLSTEAFDYFKSEVNSVMTDFVKAIARGRGLPAAQVLADFGKGRTMMAQAAKRAGMIDRIATVDAAFARWGISASTMESRRRGEAVGGDEPQAAVVVDLEKAAAEAKSVVFHQTKKVVDDDEVISVYVMDEWPKYTMIAAEAIRVCTAVIIRDGEKIDIKAENGSAQYKMIGNYRSPSADLFELQEGSTFEPPPPFDEQPADIEDDTSARASAARHRRLALLRA